LLNSILEKIKEDRANILTEDAIVNYLSPRVRVIKEMDVKNISNIQEWTNHLNLKYNALQKLLVEKSDIKNIISIKNIAQDYCTIIGLVREVKDGTERVIVDMEDTTGFISVSMAKNDLSSKIVPDDVIAVSGRLVGNMFEADNLTWPDIPLRQPIKGYGKMVFLANSQLDDKTAELVKTADYVLVHGCVGWEALAAQSSARWIVTDGGAPNVTSVRVPCVVEIDGLTVLIHFGPEQAADVLRRRYVSVNGSDFLIDAVPDVVFTSAAETFNYKGVTVIGNGLIDAATREIGQ
jgi:hypothetical protein